MSEEEQYVVDTSAILTRKLNLSQENFIIPFSVLQEIRLGKIARAIEWQEENMHISQPGTEAVEKVKEAAAVTGDLEELSQTDIDVLAVALELKAIVVTDDYAIENVASKLGLKFVGADLHSITKSITWQFRCTGCGRRYDKFRKECPVCGHAIRRTVKSYKRSENNSP